MSLNTIILAPQQIGELYGLQLVADGMDSGTVPSRPAPALLGDFAKKVLILVNEPAHAYLSDEDLKLLTGILTACNLSMQDVGVLNISGSDLKNAAQIDRSLEPATWWLFGLDSTQLGMEPMENSEHTYFYQQAPVFWSPALSELAVNPIAKRALWGQLRKHYGV